MLAAARSDTQRRKDRKGKTVGDPGIVWWTAGSRTSRHELNP